MTTYYELLEVAPDAPADEIKRAFRREIAKYHPDKVQHLGKEFQDIAASKAAELTQAYKTLSDAARWRVAGRIVDGCRCRHRGLAREATVDHCGTIARTAGSRPAL